MKKLAILEGKYFMKFVNNRHHEASLGAPRGFIDIVNPFRFFNLVSCIVTPKILKPLTKFKLKIPNDAPDILLFNRALHNKE